LGTGECTADLARIWVPAATYPEAHFFGAMAVSTRFAQGTDADPLADSLLPVLVYPNSTENAPSPGSGDEVIYTVVLPESGEWYLWGRLYYHGAPGDNEAANSFFVAVDDGDGRQFGNNRLFRQWHWDGDGKGNASAPVPFPLGSLSAGFHEIHVEKRETQTEPPRLDALFLTRDPDEIPTDAEARERLCPDGDCGDFTGSQCGDPTGDGRVTAADAWVVLAAAVHLGSYCTTATCDVDSDGTVTASDAMRVLEYAINSGAGDLLVCSGALDFFVEAGDVLSELAVHLDYSAATIAFGDAAGDIACTAGQPERTTLVAAQSDAAAGWLDLRVSFDTAIEGPVKIASCPYRVTAGGSALPAPTTLGASVVGHDDTFGEPRVTTALSFR
jgi:hypothetical protein